MDFKTFQDSIILKLETKIANFNNQCKLKYIHFHIYLYVPKTEK